MRRVLASMVMGVALIGGACGDGAQRASGDLPLLPGSSGGAARSAAGEAAAGSSAVSSTMAAACIEPEAGAQPIDCDDTVARPVEYRLADDIDEMGGEAVAYRVDVSVDEGMVTEIARALGVGGPVREEYGTYTVGGEGTAGGKFLSVGPDGSLSYFDESAQMATGSASASVAAGCNPDGVCTSPPMEPGREPLAPLPADLPADPDAVSKATAILESVGVATDGLSTAVERSPYLVNVVFSTEIDGIDVEGWGHSVAIGDDGVVQYLNASLGSPAKIGDYPLLDTSGAWERWTARNDQHGIPVEPGMGAAPPVAIDRSGEQEQVAETESEIREIDGVDLVLLTEHPRCPGDGLFLVPAYRLRAGDEVHVTLPAVTDEHIAPAQEGERGVAPDRSAGDAVEPCENLAGQTVPGREAEGHPPVSEPYTDTTA